MPITSLVLYCHHLLSRPLFSSHTHLITHPSAISKHDKHAPVVGESIRALVTLSLSDHAPTKLKCSSENAVKLYVKVRTVVVDYYSPLLLSTSCCCE
jgi:hypothetical protein